MVRWLQQQGLEAGSFRTEFGADDGEAPTALAVPAAASDVEDQSFAG
jgi:putative mRNA 3-end processing factor